MYRRVWHAVSTAATSATGVAGQQHHALMVGRTSKKALAVAMIGVSSVMTMTTTFCAQSEEDNQQAGDAAAPVESLAASNDHQQHEQMSSLPSIPSTDAASVTPAASCDMSTGCCSMLTSTAPDVTVAAAAKPVCPVVHAPAAVAVESKPVCPVAHTSAPAAPAAAESKPVCLVAHTSAPVAAESIPAKPVCPVEHTSALVAPAAAESTPAKPVCPVAHTRPQSSPSPTGAAPSQPKKVCPVAHGKSNASDSSSSASPPRWVHGASESSSSRPHPFLHAHAHAHATSASSTDVDDETQLDPEYGELTPAGMIPAAGRGNSEDGANWVNPSANALYRALKRKNKGIAAGDAMAVATVHQAVTSGTWEAIMEYESRHVKTCPNPTLARFQGMDGIYSHKARAINFIGGPLPFDRHDWFVDRCGKEVRYIIDYYSVEDVNPHGEIEVAYMIDARPAPTVGGMYERARVAYDKWSKGEKWW